MTHVNLQCLQPDACFKKNQQGFEHIFCVNSFSDSLVLNSIFGALNIFPRKKVTSFRYKPQQVNQIASEHFL